MNICAHEDGQRIQLSEFGKVTVLCTPHFQLKTSAHLMADKQKEDNDALYKKLLNERTEKIENLKSTYKVLSKKIPAIEQANDSNLKSGSENNISVDSKATMAFSLLGNLIDECIFDVLLGVHKDLRTRTSVCQICQSKCQGYVNETGCDIFGNSYTSNNLPSYECVNCHKMYPATRYAPHLEKCLGLAGRQSTRVANRRMGSQSPFTAVNLSEDSMGGSDIESSSFEKKRRRALGKISNDLSRLKKIRAQGSSSQGDHKASYADHIRAELEDSDASESNYRSNGRRSASPGSYAGDVNRSSSVPIKDVPRSPTSDDSFSKSDRRATAKAGRSKSKLAIYSSDEEDFDPKADFIVLRSGCRNLYFFSHFTPKMHMKLKPSLEEVQELVNSGAGNTIPIYAELHADMLTPVSAYLKVSDRSKYSFLLESVAGGETVGRYSFIGSDPYKVIKVGQNEQVKGDPLNVVENELKDIKYVTVPGLPSFTGGAVGYIGFECFQHFEPTLKRDLTDPIGIPEAIFVLCDTLVVFDRVRQVVNVVSHFRSNVTDPEDVKREYMKAAEEIECTLTLLNDPHTPEIPQPPIKLGYKATSNVGKDGYEGFVTNLKHHIKEGDIFQAVPSQRLSRPTSLNPFNVYRHLRSINPSPYMFYVNLDGFQIVGASPEMLTKVENRTVYTHPIAGTRKRGKNYEEDKALAEDLLADPKERAEHVMLVDLGRNDVNHVCKPETVKVDKLMEIEMYSHVMHIVSNVSGKLRDDKTPYDAFRAIFPAGTVSGAPKIRAVDLIMGLEKEKRGVYAGSVGHFDYSGNLDTCIAIRTMVFKDGIAYLQAGGGIVYDSVEEDEYHETMNKMGSNLTAIAECELKHYEAQQEELA